MALAYMYCVSNLDVFFLRIYNSRLEHQWGRIRILNGYSHCYCIRHPYHTNSGSYQNNLCSLVREWLAFLSTVVRYRWKKRKILIFSEFWVFCGYESCTSVCSRLWCWWRWLWGKSTISRGFSRWTVFTYHLFLSQKKFVTQSLDLNVMYRRRG